MFSRLINYLKKKFRNKQDDETKPIQQEPSNPPEDQSKKEEKLKPDNDWLDWTKKALDISQKFEGQDPWANITGNFDGVGLTCGALGWTIKWYNQQRLVDAFVLRHGVDKLKSLMPKTGIEYIQLCAIKQESLAISKAAEWSLNGNSSTVLNPYLNELRAFWKSQEMIEIQIEFAFKDMGLFAKQKTIECQSYFKLDKPKFLHFAYWFDQAVLNGTNVSIPLYEEKKVSVRDVLEFCRIETGYGQKDTRLNRILWEKNLNNCTDDQIALLKLAYIRAKKSRSIFDTITMNRRGTLAIGKGYVNGELHQIY